MKTFPLISWPGGKSRHLKRLLPHIPAGAGYIEAFAGGCALLLAKPKSKMEVVNDVNGYLITQFREEVAKLKSSWIVTLDDSPFNRDLFNGCDIDFIQTRNGSGNQANGPTRFYGELIIHSPGLR